MSAGLGAWMAYVQLRDIVLHPEAELVSALWDVPHELALENDTEDHGIQSAPTGRPPKDARVGGRSDDTVMSDA